ncbi:hypothetical protein EXS74_00475 [Candidatus Woesearchaeota archaeon]|nr:hypothetical protein [Candidatus Woesearchaeota archaeon]
MYAFSHPGIAATNVLALYGDELNVQWFVGRENPTSDILYPLELGYWNEKTPVYNPLYSYPEDYSSKEISLDFSTIQYDFDLGKPYFDINGNGIDDSGDFALGTKTPTMFGKDYYSRGLTAALKENGALTDTNWPASLATEEETQRDWPFRETINNYEELGTNIPNLKVLLLFGVDDHVQTVKDKPHIHQAYDGFTSAGIWVRLNPDESYIQDVGFTSISPDNDANTQPSDWNTIEDWSHPSTTTSAKLLPYAAIMEMADRTEKENWENNLDSVLF